MQMLDHPNIVAIKHCFFSTTDKEELYLNLVLEFVPETVNRVARQYSRLNQQMPLIYVKLYTYQACNNLSNVFQICFLNSILYTLACTCMSVHSDIWVFIVAFSTIVFH